jgi:hypothetical protein
LKKEPKNFCFYGVFFAATRIAIGKGFCLFFQKKRFLASLQSTLNGRCNSPAECRGQLLIRERLHQDGRMKAGGQPCPAHENMRHGEMALDFLHGGDPAAGAKPGVNEHQIGAQAQRGLHGLGLDRRYATHIEIHVLKDFREEDADHGIVLDDQDPELGHDTLSLLRRRCAM